MKKIIFITLVFFISLNFFNISSAKSYKVGDIFENKIKFSRSFTLPLSPGKWEVVNQYNFNYFVGSGFTSWEPTSIQIRSTFEVQDGVSLGINFNGFRWVLGANLGGKIDPRPIKSRSQMASEKKVEKKGASWERLGGVLGSQNPSHAAGRGCTRARWRSRSGHS